MKPLTATQKLRLHDLHSRYMVNECQPSGGYDAKYVGGLFKEFTDYCAELGIDILEAQSVSWQTNQAFHATWLEAHEREGWQTDAPAATIAYIRREAAREIARVA